MSDGADKLLQIVQELFPNQRIELEYNVAERGALFLDIFLPRLKIGFEFDGRQHFEYVEHFHGSKDNFLRARRRDYEKTERCEQLGITLVRVAYYEEMDRESVRRKIEQALGG